MSIRPPVPRNLVQLLADIETDASNLCPLGENCRICGGEHDYKYRITISLYADDYAGLRSASRSAYAAFPDPPRPPTRYPDGNVVYHGRSTMQGGHTYDGPAYKTVVTREKK